METAEEGSTVMVRLHDGEDVFASLEAACAKHEVESGVIRWGIGMLRDFELGFFAPTGYQRKTFPDRHELVAFHGSIARRAEPKFHIHAAGAGPDLRLVGGHLFRATCCVMNEICLERFRELRLNRKHNPVTNLNELSLE